MPDPGPFGDTFLRAIVRAIFSADPVNVPRGGAVETVLTFLTHRLVLATTFKILDGAFVLLSRR